MTFSRPQVRAIAVLVLSAAMVLGGPGAARGQDLGDLELGEGLGGASRLLNLASGKASAVSIFALNLSLVATAGLVRRLRRGQGCEEMEMSRWSVHHRANDPGESRIEILGRAPGWGNVLLSWVGLGVRVEFVAACDQARLRRVGVTSERHWAIHLAGFPSCSLKYERNGFWLFLAAANIGFALIANIDAIAALVVLLAMAYSLGAYFLSRRFLLEIADKQQIRLAFRPSFVDGAKLDREDAVSAFNLLQEMILAANSRTPSRFRYDSVAPDEDQDFEDDEALVKDSDIDDESEDFNETADKPSRIEDAASPLSSSETAARRILEKLKRLPRDDPQWNWKMKSGLELIVRDYPGTETARIASSSLAKLKGQAAGRSSKT